MTGRFLASEFVGQEPDSCPRISSHPRHHEELVRLVVDTNVFMSREGVELLRSVERGATRLCASQWNLLEYLIVVARSLLPPCLHKRLRRSGRRCPRDPVTWDDIGLSWDQLKGISWQEMLLPWPIAEAVVVIRGLLVDPDAPVAVTASPGSAVAELLRVLLPRLEADPGWRGEILTLMRCPQGIEYVSVGELAPIGLPDPCDEEWALTASTCRADLLVSSDNALLGRKSIQGIPVVTPREALDLLGS
jgi:hypothetical protein